MKSPTLNYNCLYSFYTSWSLLLCWIIFSELCVALIDAANDKQLEVRQMIMTSLHELGKKQPEMVLSAIKGYLVKHQKVWCAVQVLHAITHSRCCLHVCLVLERWSPMFMANGYLPFVVCHWWSLRILLKLCIYPKWTGTMLNPAKVSI